MKKTLNIVKSILVWMLVAAAVLMMIFTVVSVNTFDRNDRDIFGYKALIVLSDSMSKIKHEDGRLTKGYFNAGGFIFIKEVDPSTLKAGDIIAYTSTNTENYGETVTHKIKELVTTESGEPGFITYGTTTNTDDDNIVTYPFVLGKYEGKLPAIGNFFNFLKTTQGYIICIFLPFLLLILIQGYNSIRLFKRYRAEQLAEIESQRAKEREELEAERAAMAEERKKQEEMMAKLLEMQAELAKKSGEDKPEPSEGSAEPEIKTGENDA